MDIEKMYEKEDMTAITNFPRQKIREIVVQVLYSIDVGEANSDIINMVTNELAVARRHVSAAFTEASNIYEKRARLDEILLIAVKNSPFGQMTCLEKNIMRLALYEFLALRDKSSKRNLIVTEAIRLTKKFSTPEASKFVNAVLDEIFYEKDESLEIVEQLNSVANVV